ncbi:TR129 protein, partial [Atractosteus spatula]|nr:TR129 protein [Atractosteus spatula]
MSSLVEKVHILLQPHAPLLLCCGLLVLLGIAWNIWNLGVVSHQLCKSKTYQTVDLIILCISSSNILLDISAFGYLFTIEFDLHCMKELHTVVRTILYVFFSTTCLSFWSITWLCVFYCVKIVNIPMAFFIIVKRNISSVINAALILSVLGCLIMYAPFFFFELPSHAENTTANGTLNIDCPDLKVNFSSPIDTDAYLYIFLCFLCPIPLAIMLTTSIQLVSHLWKHTRSMKKNENKFQSRDSYLLIVRMILSLVFVYLLTICIAFICFLIQKQSSQLANQILIPNMSFFCMATGILLTTTNKNLKEKFTTVCCCKKPQNETRVSERLT